MALLLRVPLTSLQARITDARAALAAAQAAARTTASRTSSRGDEGKRSGALGHTLNDGTTPKSVLKPYPPTSQKSPGNQTFRSGASGFKATGAQSEVNTASVQATTAFGEQEQEEEFVVPAWTGGRAFRCLPGAANFGALELRKRYRLKLNLLNADVGYSKFRLRQPKNSSVSVIYSPQAVAAGMSVPLEVEMSCTAAGEIKDELIILSEGEQFAVPIRATVVDSAQYMELQRTYGSPPEAEGVQLVDTVPMGFTLKATRSGQVGSRGKSLNEEFAELNMTLGDVQALAKTHRKAEWGTTKGFGTTHAGGPRN